MQTCNGFGREFRIGIRTACEGSYIQVCLFCQVIEIYCGDNAFRCAMFANKDNVRILHAHTPFPNADFMCTSISWMVYRCKYKAMALIRRPIHNKIGGLRITPEINPAISRYRCERNGTQKTREGVCV